MGVLVIVGESFWARLVWVDSWKKTRKGRKGVAGQLPVFNKFRRKGEGCVGKGNFPRVRLLGGRAAAVCAVGNCALSWTGAEWSDYPGINKISNQIAYDSGDSGTATLGAGIRPTSVSRRP